MAEQIFITFDGELKIKFVSKFHFWLKPDKTRELYMKTYKHFCAWKNCYAMLIFPNFKPLKVH
jgi:hypothetical protein